MVPLECTVSGSARVRVTNKFIVAARERARGRGRTWFVGDRGRGRHRCRVGARCWRKKRALNHAERQSRRCGRDRDGSSRAPSEPDGGGAGRRGREDHDGGAGRGGAHRRRTGQTVRAGQTGTERMGGAKERLSTFRRLVSARSRLGHIFSTRLQVNPTDIAPLVSPSCPRGRATTRRQSFETRWIVCRTRTVRGRPPWSGPARRPQTRSGPRPNRRTGSRSRTTRPRPARRGVGQSGA